MRWIDTHVHLFSAADDNTGIPLVQARQKPNTPDVYFDLLSEQKPEGVVVVDFSMAKHSGHVVHSLDELKKQGIKAAGVIKGDLSNPDTLTWIARDDVKGIRLYARDAVPDTSGAAWDKLFALLRQQKKHILIFGVGVNLVGLVKQLPQDITLLIDHLGMPDIYNANGDEAFDELLRIVKARKNVYFKGPGYRTSLNVAQLKPVLKRIVESVGADHVILGASDGPFAGPVMEPTPEYQGKKFAEVMDYSKVLKFINTLAKEAGNDDRDCQRMLYDNAKELYGF